MNLRTILKDYLDMRRKLGYKLKTSESVLENFITFFENQKKTYLTTHLAVKWARKSKSTNPGCRADRLTILRGFAAYWKMIDPRTEVPPLHILGPHYKRATPHIYTDQQIAQILDATWKLPSKDSYTYWTLFGLLLATGMRIGEALALDDEDIDLKQGLITIRKGKLDKPRILPLHATTRKILRQYIQKRDLMFLGSKPPAFFVINKGRRLSILMAQYTFRKVMNMLGLRTLLQLKSVRLYDFRHTFATRALTRFYQNGHDIDAKIHALSIYLGHKYIQCTYWYLTNVPELMNQVLSRLENKMGGDL
jgi:integrase/recombinase XerD